MAWLCPECKKLQHQIHRCKFCGYKEKDKNKKLTAEKLIAIRKYKMPNEYWVRRRKS